MFIVNVFFLYNSSYRRIIMIQFPCCRVEMIRYVVTAAAGRKDQHLHVAWDSNPFYVVFKVFFQSCGGSRVTSYSHSPELC